MEISEFPVVRGLKGILKRNLGPGEIGVVAARAGVGKTALLTLIALSEISDGGRVLHVCIDEPPEKVKIWYEELLRSSNPSLSFTTVKTLTRAVEQYRFVLSYLHNSFSLGKLEEALKGIVEQTSFRPTVAVIDGLDFDRCEKRFVPRLRELLQKYEIPAWLSVQLQKYPGENGEAGLSYPCDLLEGDCAIMIIMESNPEGGFSLKLVKEGIRLTSPRVFSDSDVLSFLSAPGSGR
ncbi:hypothetical protein [Thermodesulforhabdus norvegica]|uniref:AAA domain-containing protein n=1 Tax=Thermodesulforhabdus norvegica TaxID=39841 RepID=A0A1I4R7E7_9BACT|nr:hypothetical protein [Thermodesulforhabdus norvegica]SFM48085.1 hypothetical protein SAMN05660836_00442 [Thermodesulforhabdus norvegica]